MSGSFFDKIGSSNRRLALIFLFAACVTVAGGISPVGGAAVNSGIPFLGGAVFALGLTSWQLNATDRTLRAATQLYWKDFASDAVIYLATLPPNGAVEADPSPLTPYHDSLAGQRVQEHLMTEYESKTPIVSVGDIPDLSAIRAKNVILIGGPNLNHLTDELMTVVWERWQNALFHWSSTVSQMDATRSMVTDARDHFLRLQSVSGELQVEDSVFDLHDQHGNLIEARGMCLRLAGVLGPGSQVLVLAGAANAYGTLAAADHVMDPSNLLHLTSTNSQLVVGARINGYGLHDAEVIREICPSG